MKTISVVEAQKQLTDLIEDFKGGTGCPFEQGSAMCRAGRPGRALRSGIILIGAGQGSTSAAGPSVPENQGGGRNSVLRNPQGSRQAASQREKAAKAPTCKGFHGFVKLGRVLCHEPETSEIPSEFEVAARLAPSPAGAPSALSRSFHAPLGPHLIPLGSDRTLPRAARTGLLAAGSLGFCQKFFRFTQEAQSLGVLRQRGSFICSRRGEASRLLPLTQPAWPTRVSSSGWHTRDR